MEANPKLSSLARILTLAVALLNLGDIALHVAIDDVEPLRVTGNIVVIVAAFVLLLWPRARRLITPIIAAAVNLVLNNVFIALEGIGLLGVVLIAVTTLLLVALALTLRRPRT